MARLTTILALLSYCIAALAVDISGVVQWNEHCSSFAELGYAKVVLDNGVASGSITRDGRFVIPDVPAGTYIASVVSHDHRFDRLRIDVLPEADSLPEIRAYTIGTPLNPPAPIKLVYPIKLVPRARNTYFVPHESFNIIGMFQNPMMLMMGFGALMMFGMPMLMKNMDPDMMKDFQETQAKVAKFQTSFQDGDLKSSLQAFTGVEELPRAGVTTATTKQSNSSSGGSAAKNRGNKKKRG